MEGHNIIKHIQTGTQGQVYLCEKEGQEYALKIFARDNENAFKREKNALKILHGSPRIIQRHVIGNEKSLQLSTSFCKNGDLCSFLQKSGILSESISKTLLRHILEAVQISHGKNIIHRDLKPENLFLDDKMKVMLGDFGLADIIDLTTNSQYLVKGESGTASYMAPETFSKDTFDGRGSDLWMCACIFFVMIANYPPFGEDGARPKSWHVQQLRKGRKDIFWKYHDKYSEQPIGAGAKAFMDKCFELDASKRPSIADLLNDPWLSVDILSDDDLCLQMKSMLGPLPVNTASTGDDPALPQQEVAMANLDIGVPTNVDDGDSGLQSTRVMAGNGHESGSAS